MLTQIQIDNFRARIPDQGRVNPDTQVTEYAFTDPELEKYLEEAISEHTDGLRTSANMTEADWPMALLLAYHSALSALGTESSRYFKWSEGDVSGDKTKQATACIRLAREALRRYQVQLAKKKTDQDQGIRQNVVSNLWHMR